MAKEKLKTLAEVRQYLSSIERINQGGCGVAALAMYKWLAKHDEIDHHFKFVFCYASYDEYTYVNNVGVLKNKIGKAIACEHIGIYYDDKYLDCNSELPLTRYGTIQFVSYDQTWFIQNAINNIGSWNPAFNRNKWIPKIEKELGISLKEIEIPKF